MISRVTSKSADKLSLHNRAIMSAIHGSVVAHVTSVHNLAAGTSEASARV